MINTSKIVVRLLEIMFMVVAFSKIYPASNQEVTNNADKRVAESSRAECLGIK